jgi:hypothetical protein
MISTQTKTPVRFGNRLRRGTSLIEVLVVIVVFLIGILALVQIFPGGFKLLNRTRDNAMATELGRGEVERLKARVDQLPEMILPVDYQWTGSDYLVVANSSRLPAEMGPNASGLLANGNLIDASNNVLGRWDELTGANLTRRIVREGRRVPAPRLINSATGEYGCLMTLQFGPILYNPQFQSLFAVVGNDMYLREGTPERPLRPYEFYVDGFDTSSATVSLPSSSAGPISYSLSFTAYTNSGGGVTKVSIVDLAVTAPASGFGFQTLTLSTYVPNFVGCDFDSFRCARRYDQIATIAAFNSTNPYEFKVLNGPLGQILFNPAAFDTQVQQPNGRRAPLQARVSYDVYDWRILRDDFRIDDAVPAQHKVPLQNLRVIGGQTSDGSTWTGLPYDMPDGVGGIRRQDLILVDLETGGTYLYDPMNPADPSPSTESVNQVKVDPTKSSIYVDKSAGRIQFLDFDRDPSNGLQLRLVLPGATTPVTVNGAGRMARILYMANNEWAVQVTKAPASYDDTTGLPGIAQFYVGASGVPGGLPTRIYFPRSDNGQTVSIDEIYGLKGGAVVGPLSYTGVLQVRQADPLGLPSLDVSTLVDALDATQYGYAVRGVKGASVSVRVLHNSSKLNLTNSSPANLGKLNSYIGQWQKSTTQTFLQRGVN